MNLKKLKDLDEVVERGTWRFGEYLEINGRDFLSSYSITRVALSALLVNQEFTPEHIKLLFPKYAEFIRKTN